MQKAILIVGNISRLKPELQQKRLGRLSVWILISAALSAGCDGPVPSNKNADASASSAVTKSGAVNDPSADKAKIDAFPEPANWKICAPGVERTTVALGIPPGTPGSSDHLILYRPRGQTKKHSLGCVFVAPAGAPMFAGNAQGDGDAAEHLPYVKAGYAVAAFDIDGEFPGGSKDLAVVHATFAKFKAAEGGVVNGKNAIEYVLAKLPQIDPERLYVAGHSSAATFALLFAEHEPRLKGCIAYAPLADLFDDSRGGKASVEKLLPGIASLSPMENCDLLKCPVFLFHSEGDGNVPIGISRRFVEKLKQTNSDVTFKTVPSGDHYNSMIEPGIPLGIAWLKSRAAEKKAAPTLPVNGGG